MNTFSSLIEGLAHLRVAWRSTGVEVPSITLHFKNDRDKHRFSDSVKRSVDTEHMVTTFTNDPTRSPDVIEILGIRVILYSPHDFDRGRAFEPPRG